MSDVRRCRASIGALVLLAVVIGCGGSDDAPPRPDSLQVSFGQGGGVTGHWRGFTIHPDGSLDEWGAPGAEDDTVQVGIVREPGREAMWKAIQRSGFLETTSDERANMTRTIQVVVDGAVHRAWWPLTIRGGSELDPLYEELHALVQAHRAERQTPDPREETAW